MIGCDPITEVRSVTRVDYGTVNSGRERAEHTNSRERDRKSTVKELDNQNDAVVYGVVNTAEGVTVNSDIGR